MPIAINPAQKWDYILKCDRSLPSEQQTVFELKVLSARELAKIEDGSARADMEGGIEFRSGSQTLKILDVGLTGWKNFKLENGGEVAFRENNGTSRPENWDFLRPEWRRELANAVTEQVHITVEEGKN